MTAGCVAAALAVVGVALLTFYLVVAVLCWLDPPAPPESDRERLRREALEGSWRIQQHASQAFSQMLQAARQSDREKRA